MCKKSYESPEMDIYLDFQDVIIMSGTSGKGGTGFDTDDYDNSTGGGIGI